MGLGLLRPLRRAINVLCGGSTPHEIALGLTLGMLLGLVPKSNLTAVCLLGLILTLRLNLSAAVASAILFTSLTPVLDGVAHRIGLFALQLGLLQSVWAWLFSLPLVPWMRLDNSVVLGQILIGLLLAGPNYGLAKDLIARVQPSVVAVMSRSALARTALGVRPPVEGRAA